MGHGGHSDSLAELSKENDALKRDLEACGEMREGERQATTKRINELTEAATRLLVASNAGREAIQRVIGPVVDSTFGDEGSTRKAVTKRWEKEQPTFAERQAAADALLAVLAKYAPEPKPPVGYGEVLDSKYQLLLHDKGCNEPIGWGFGIKMKIEDKALNEALKTHGDIEFLHGAVEGFEFGLIVRWLTEEEATKKYGKPGEVEYGPRGGFKQVFYGTTPFNHKRMKPAGAK